MEFKQSSSYNLEGFKPVKSMPHPRKSMERDRWVDLINYFDMSDEKILAKECATAAEAKRVNSGIIGRLKRMGIDNRIFSSIRGKTVYIAKGKRDDW